MSVWSGLAGHTFSTALRDMSHNTIEVDTITAQQFNFYNCRATTLTITQNLSIWPCNSFLLVKISLLSSNCETRCTYTSTIGISWSSMKLQCTYWFFCSQACSKMMQCRESLVSLSIFVWYSHMFRDRPHVIQRHLGNGNTVFGKICIFNLNT